MKDRVYKIIDRFRNKLNQNRRTPYQISKNGLRILVTGFLDPLGMDCVNKCKIYWKTFIIAVFVLQHCIFTVYTAFYYWNINKLSVLQPMTVFAISMPVCILLKEIKTHKLTSNIISKSFFTYINMIIFMSTRSPWMTIKNCKSL